MIIRQIRGYISYVMVDIACVGHITQDHIITSSLDYYASGGTAYYISVGVSSLISKDNEESSETTSNKTNKLSFQLVTKEGPQHFFENKYGENMNNRQQRVLSVADPFTMQDLCDVNARYIILGSLLASDFSVEIIKEMSKRGTLVLDVQGFLREVRGEKVYAVDWEEKLEALRYVDILKVNEYEMEVITGCSDAHQAALKLAEWGVKEVLLTFGSFGSLVYDSSSDTFYDIPAFPPNPLVDATGCGDTYVMGYVYKRAQGASVEESAIFAARVSTAKLQVKGPYRDL